MSVGQALMLLPIVGFLVLFALAMIAVIALFITGRFMGMKGDISPNDVIDELEARARARRYPGLRRVK